MEPAGSCRCACHPTTQALLKAGPKKPDGRGGVRRTLKQNITAAVAAFPQPPGLLVAPDPEESLELRNTCPKCKTVAKHSDVFCRIDGTKLCIGKPCERCSGPCEETDKFCWSCGWHLGDAVPERPAPSPLPPTGLKLDLTPSLPPGAEELTKHESVQIESSAPAPTEDPILRLRRQLKEQGLLPKETVVA